MSIIDDRYSVRVFNAQQVEDEKVKSLLEAAMCAPSSKNKKPWQFIVLSDPHLIEEVAAFHKNWSILKAAHKVIIVCGDLQCDERQAHMLMACSAASQNILLKATELGLGSVWLGCFPDEQRINFIQQKLKTPSHIVPVAVIPVGYTDQVKKTKRTIDQDKIHFGGWD